MSEEINYWTQDVIRHLNGTGIDEHWWDEAQIISEDIADLERWGTAEKALAAHLEATFYEDVDWDYVARYILRDAEAER